MKSAPNGRPQRCGPPRTKGVPLREQALAITQIARAAHVHGLCRLQLPGSGLDL